MWIVCVAQRPTHLVRYPMLRSLLATCVETRRQFLFSSFEGAVGGAEMAGHRTASRFTGVRYTHNSHISSPTQFVHTKTSPSKPHDPKTSRVRDFETRAQMGAHGKTRDNVLITACITASVNSPTPTPTPTSQKGHNKTMMHKTCLFLFPTSHRNTGIHQTEQHTSLSHMKPSTHRITPILLSPCQ